jgi:hypothetical protein
LAITGHKTEAIYRRYNIVSDADITDAGQRWAAYVEDLSTKMTVVPLRPAATAT